MSSEDTGRWVARIVYAGWDAVPLLVVAVIGRAEVVLAHMPVMALYAWQGNIWEILPIVLSIVGAVFEEGVFEFPSRMQQALVPVRLRT